MSMQAVISDMTSVREDTAATSYIETSGQMTVNVRNVTAHDTIRMAIP
jgi:hypothetical protein